ncbi:MAG: hypothetical protein ABS68_13890 [Niastella sp. SCN 39-18]|nr:hypothetical protein [Sphingobacteriales bacterium]ODT49929.1 MAG: hypothetical protein ABS68_13890 [Niastella sp. SCN 39-18]OJW07524.1 MAG: hypothetical protein BGO53_03175 [Sphingobacteriales bacterium 39-19]
MPNKPEKSQHILTASSNLLGICFILLTTFRVFKVSHVTIADEITTIAIVMFMASCIFSFLSLRSSSLRAHKYEQIADVVFLLGLGILFVTTILFSFNLIA